MTSYRGFIFAKLGTEGLTLEESLGHMMSSLDDMVDRAPEGEIEVAGGVFRMPTTAIGKSILKMSVTPRTRGLRIGHPLMRRRSKLMTHFLMAVEK